MLFCFLGAPCSGKTTTASRLFADLKDEGHISEFIPELARYYIAGKRKVSGGGKISLDDSDQFQIMRLQAKSEELMNTPKTIVIADSSPINALLYLSYAARRWFEIETEVQASLNRCSLFFRCPPITPPVGLDSNRIHDFEASLLLDEKLTRITQELQIKTILLSGDTNTRAKEAAYHILRKFTYENSH